MTRKERAKMREQEIAREMNNEFEQKTFCPFLKTKCRQDCVAFRGAEITVGRWSGAEWVNKHPKCRMMKLPYRPDDNDGDFTEGLIIGGMLGGSMNG